MREAVITGGARTAVGRLLGSLKDFTAAQLGGVVIKAALERAGLTGDQADYVIMGQVLQAGAGQNPARQAAVAAGIPMTVPSMTINKVCLSGLDAIALAAQLIRAGEFDVVVAGGMESMTGAPHLLPGARAGHKYGSIELLDAMARDGLTDAFDHSPMGELTDRHNARLGISRAEQDEFAARSHQRAAAAIKDGLLAGEIVGVPVPQRRGDPVRVRHRRGGPAGHHGGGAERAAAGVRRRRHDHGRLVLADLRRRLRRGRDVGRGRGASAVRRCWPRSARTVSWPARTPRCSPSRRPRSGTRSARPGWAWPTWT